MQNILDTLLFAAVFSSVLVGFGAVCDGMSESVINALCKFLFGMGLSDD